MNGGRAVIVTGSGGAIGTAICQRLVEDGFDVVGVDLHGAGAGSSERLVYVCGDVTDKVVRDRVFARATCHGDALVGLVNCAAVVRTSPPLDVSQDEWRRSLDVNVCAAYFFAVEAAALMQKNGSGSIVNITSIAGARPSPTNMAYGASKAALASITSGLAAALAADGIRVNAVSPGLIDTASTAVVDLSLAEIAGVSPADVRTRRLAGIPMGRMGSVGEVAAAVSFLVSDQASYITGQALHVNGGSLMST